jgi:electron transfer flavoprotein alpha subunit
MRVAALVKQVPPIDGIELDDSGRLRRGSAGARMSDYCRRAVAQGRKIANDSGGDMTVITLGPPGAVDVLREALAFGANYGALVSDPALAGSDTLATSHALAAALRKLGPFDIILCGLNSIDADTGQVPPQLATLLGLPFCGGVRELELEGSQFRLGLEHDDEWLTAVVDAPVVLSCAERLCDPCKILDENAWPPPDDPRIARLTATDLGDEPWGTAASRTEVGALRHRTVHRLRARPGGPPAEQVEAALAILADHEATRQAGPVADVPAVPEQSGDATKLAPVAVLIERDQPEISRELLGKAAGLAAEIGGHVVALGALPPDLESLSSWGADAALDIPGDVVAEDVANTLAGWVSVSGVSILIGPGTAWGREVLARVAARLDAGMTGDAVELEIRDGRLVAWKPALGGSTRAEITCSSPLQIASVRPGVLPALPPRPSGALTRTELPADRQSRVHVLERRRDEPSNLTRAEVVVCLGMGVDVSDYPLAHELADRIGGVLCATRKVTDRGWQPRSRQVGVTAHSIAPRLYLAVGVWGSFQHAIGFQGAATVIAVNTDPAAPIFDASDIGITADWRAVLPRLADGIAALSANGEQALAASNSIRSPRGSQR